MHQPLSLPVALRRAPSYRACRMLKRVSVTGTQDGEPVYHEYSYIDFRPYVAPPSAFEVGTS